jgi:hypothetical protein
MIFYVMFHCPRIGGTRGDAQVVQNLAKVLDEAGDDHVPLLRCVIFTGFSYILYL